MKKKTTHLNVEATLLVHVEVEMEQGQGLGSWLGLRLNACKENLIKKTRSSCKFKHNVTKKFNPIAYTKTIGVALRWKDFEDFHKLIAYVQVPLGACTCKFSNPNSFPIFLG
jgi:hypothetical protein